MGQSWLANSGGELAAGQCQLTCSKKMRGSLILGHCGLCDSFKFSTSIFAIFKKGNGRRLILKSLIIFMFFPHLRGGVPVPVRFVPRSI